MTDVAPGEIGTLLVKGDSAAAFYWNKHQKTRQTIMGQWVNTGDKYYQDEQGYFYCAGRSDDMLKVGGIWVSPNEVESCLIKHPAVLECAVIGAPDENNLIKPMAFVVLKKPDQSATHMEAELQDFVKSSSPSINIRGGSAFSRSSPRPPPEKSSVLSYATWSIARQPDRLVSTRANRRKICGL